MRKPHATRLTSITAALLGTTFLSTAILSVPASEAYADTCSGQGNSSYSLTDNPGQPITGTASGGAGCNGRGATFYQDGQSGGPGGASPGFSVPVLAQPIMASAVGITLNSTGGQGGTGSRSGEFTSQSSYGGSGGMGGSGGTITLSTGLNAAVTGSSGVVIAATGGAGGSGNTGWNNGQGGTGGAGGNITLSFASPVTGSSGPGISATSTGGTGGNGSGVAAGVPFGFRAASAGAGGSGGTINITTSANVTAGGVGITTSSQGGTGGNGGNAGNITGFGGNGASGGRGGGITVNVASGTTVSAPNDNTGGIIAQANAGDGGSGGYGRGVDGTGGDGGNGGNGGSSSGMIAGAVSATGARSSGALFMANGGDGGAGGTAAGFVAGAGYGGDGGAGGQSSATVAASGSVLATQDFATGLGISANGGNGGQGGNAGAAVSQAGAGGAGGAGGTATGTNNGLIQTTGNFAPGILGQSVGGVGGNGARAFGVFYDNGGSGSAGGNGGSVQVQTGSGSNTNTTGIGSAALLAQSVGGGGGYGGNATGVPLNVGIQLGGNGNQGGSAGNVSVTNAGTLTTSGIRADGINAQSVGGGGGQGGDAFGIGLAPINVAIGGDSGSGGNGGQVIVANSGLITTVGPHASGVSAQSIGGGGGKGGTATSYTASAGLGFGVTIGGNGGSGGTGGEVGNSEDPNYLTNANQITTYGTDSYGVRFQSVGGGGGEGGAATAFNVAISPDPEEIPAVSMTIALGGNGGNGGAGGLVTLNNGGFIATGANGSVALFGQSVGGGGGNGGDASASSNAYGGEANISISLSLGGSGGTGGAGGNVNIANSGLVLTAGESAYGAFAQSVGGGGGQAGGGDAGSSSGEGDGSFSLSLALGGNGGNGNTGGAIGITNNGGIVTLGDGSRGVFGQSIGGGGGVGGGGAADADGGALSLKVGVGGNGGTGGTGGAVTITNNAAVATFGSDATAIMAQSIGGGGGAGGKAGKSEGKSSNHSGGNGQLDVAIAGGIGLGETVTNEGGIANQVGDGKLSGITGMSDLIKVIASTLGLSAPGDSTDTAGSLNDISEENGGDEEGGGSPNINLGVSIGGSAGAGGNGGAITVTNKGELATIGHMSDAVQAQSVGGGGGTGGVATSSTSKQVNAAFSIGGAGGASGTGGTVTVNNAGNITTIGGMASGIVAHSVGGGGGIGGTSASKSGGLTGLSLALGGNGGSGGAGGNVQVTNAGGIVTLSHDSIGIIGQSVGGGGGIAKIRSSDNDSLAGGAQPDSDAFSFNLTVGGAGGSSGDGGTTTISNQGSITTSGRNAYGILAQSVGGGGGLSTGGRLSGVSFFGVDISGNGVMSGNGGAVTVNHSGAITTTGTGAIGILAQSVGGGGGIAGDTGNGSGSASFTQSSRHTGNGGAVNVTLGAGSSVGTTGANATAIYAQSIGGGGGLFTSSAGVLNGSAGGSGAGGPINISIAGTVTASGSGSDAIYANSAGSSANAITIAVTNTGVVVAQGSARAAIEIAGGATNTINNSGTISGNVINPGGSLNILSGGNLRSAANVTAAQVNNAGTIWIGTQDGAFQATTVNGALTSTGAIVADVDFAGQTSDNLTVTGNANVSGTFIVSPVTLIRDKTVEVMNAGTLNTSGLTVQDNGNYIFSYTGQQQGNAYSVTSSGADFTPGDATLTRNQQAAAAHLQSAWDSGEAAALSESFAQLSKVGDAAGYGRTLNTLTGSVGGAIGATKHLAGHHYFSHMNSCPTFVGTSMALTEQTCVWGRIAGGWTDLDTNRKTDGFNQTTQSFQVGAQKEIGAGWFLGGSLAYERSRFEADNNADRIEGDSVWASVLLKHQIGNWTISGAIDAGYGWYDSQRYLTYGGLADTARASPNAQYAGIHTRIAYYVPLEALYLKPYLDLHASYSRTDGYTESGASPLVLHVMKEDDVKFSASPMLEVGGKYTFDNGMVLRPFVSGGAVFSDDNSWGARARFVGSTLSAGTFEAVAALPKTLGKVKAGAELYATENAQFKLEYTGEFGRDYQSNIGMVKFNYAF